MNDKKQLLLDLFNAHDAEDVFKIVNQYKIDGPEFWKPYGGNPNNAGTFENQQSTPENALVEKITNSIDAILMKECYKRGIDPKAKDGSVPQDMLKAVEKFYGVHDGKWENWTDSERNAIAQNIQVILTEDKTTPNVTIYDNGEGQNPGNFPDTFLSIAHGNKNDIPFVQGKYNFGATGAVVFCGDGEYRYQMIISRRNTELSDGNGLIGFTLVRRHILSKEEENKVKLTWYEYLVLDDEIPSIPAEKLELGLNKNLPFESGTIVKMFSYQLTKPSMATTDLWRELNPLLFVPALPILIYEARDYGGHSPTKLLLGNRTRLAIDNNKKLRDKISLQTTLFNSNIPLTVYVFDRDTKNTEFIGGKSVIYTLNGQTQGHESKTFISQDLGFRNLREYMLVCVDCSQIGTTARQELFMASRDRLKQGKYYNELRNDIISLLKSEDSIKQLDQEYKGKAFRETGEDKDMIESLFSHLKANQDIKKMFAGKQGAFSFFNKKTIQKEQPHSESPKKEEEKKNLKRFPTIFKVKGFDTSKEQYVKAIRRGGKGRIILETDVENDFLSRSYDNGTIEITTLDYSNNSGSGGGYHLPSEDSEKLKVQVVGPHNGEIRLIVEPKEEAEIGESIPLSVKMISSAGEHEVIVFVKVDKDIEPQKDPKPKNIEEPELALPQLIRVVKESQTGEEMDWKQSGMDAESVVKFRLEGSNGNIESILVNMDSNLVKKLINMPGVNIERVRNKYLTTVYSHSLMLYTTLYGYYMKEDDSNNHNELVKEIQERLDEAVAFSFKYYANFLMTFEDIAD